MYITGILVFDSSLKYCKLSQDLVGFMPNPLYGSLYYGFTLGIGLECIFGENKKHRFDIDINFPFRSKEFKDDFKIIDDDPDVDIKKPFPIAFAIGYHFEF